MEAEAEEEEDGAQVVEVEEVVGAQVVVLKETQEVVLQFLLYQSHSQQQLVAEVVKVGEKVAAAVAVDGHQEAEVKEEVVVVVDGHQEEAEVKEVVVDGLQEEVEVKEVVVDGHQEEEVVREVVEVEELLSLS